MSNKLDELGLDILLQLSGEIFPMDSGYWTKIEAKKLSLISIYHMELSPKRKNMVQKGLFGIIDIKKK